jgi:cell division protein FtsN
MRIALLLLLLANLLFFSWAHMNDGNTADRLAPASSGGIRIASASSRPRTHCQRLGPFPDDNAAVAARSALAVRGLQTQLLQQQRQQLTGWAVVVSSFDSQSARDAAITRLRRAGVRDAAATSSAQGDPGLLAGVFDDQNAANARAATVERAGFKSRIEAREAQVLEHWVSVEISVAATPPGIEELGLTAPATATAPAWNSC